MGYGAILDLARLRNVSQRQSIRSSSCISGQPTVFTNLTIYRLVLATSTTGTSLTRSAMCRRLQRALAPNMSTRRLTRSLPKCFKLLRQGEVAAYCKLCCLLSKFLLEGTLIHYGTQLTLSILGAWCLAPNLHVCTRGRYPKMMPAVSHWPQGCIDGIFSGFRARSAYRVETSKPDLVWDLSSASVSRQ